MSNIVMLNSPFDEVRAIRFRQLPLKQAGRVAVARSFRIDVPDTVIVVYEDGTVWCSAITKRWGDYGSVTIYPHDSQFSGLWQAMVLVGLISKRTASLASVAHRHIGSDHPGKNLSEWSVEDFQKMIDKYGSPAGMKKAIRQYRSL